MKAKIRYLLFAVGTPPMDYTFQSSTGGPRDRDRNSRARRNLHRRYRLRFQLGT